MAKRSSRAQRLLAGGAGVNNARGSIAGARRTTRDGVAFVGVGSSLLAGLAARVWSDVTKGQGVVLDSAGREVKPDDEPKGGA